MHALAKGVAVLFVPGLAVLLVLAPRGNFAAANPVPMVEEVGAGNKRCDHADPPTQSISLCGAGRREDGGRLRRRGDGELETPLVSR